MGLGSSCGAHIDTGDILLRGTDASEGWKAGVEEEAGGEGQVVEPVRLPRGARSFAGGAGKVSEAH